MENCLLNLYWEFDSNCCWLNFWIEFCRGGGFDFTLENMGVMSRKVVPVCGNLCCFCPSLRARSRQPVKRYKKLLADILPRNQVIFLKRMCSVTWIWVFEKNAIGFLWYGKILNWFDALWVLIETILYLLCFKCRSCGFPVRIKSLFCYWDSLFLVCFKSSKCVFFLGCQDKVDTNCMFQCHCCYCYFCSCDQIVIKYFDKDSCLKYSSILFNILLLIYCRRLNQMIGKLGSFVNTLRRILYESPRFVLIHWEMPLRFWSLD